MKVKLTAEQAETIRDVVEENDCSIYEQYSGRGMYGANCFGITVSQHASTSMVGIMIRVIRKLMEDDANEELVDAFESSRCEWDSLGLDTILYFRNIEWCDEEEGEEDEEEDEE